ncbi:hypothetical protein GQ55_6G236300 [Panicum hallii var. hallii]|uniref:Uncharacterized protein n=1 Tax=Panicum hallii var. hallii TaxID=1504633 RepID=A0A2T7D8R9_9POAL|nr:hypothetical protein GQ55_6G236300 [Panicum hallii var. hallii]
METRRGSVREDGGRGPGLGGAYRLRRLRPTSPPPAPSTYCRPLMARRAIRKPCSFPSVSSLHPRSRWA